MSTIKILPELDAASSRVLSSFSVAERRCVAATETNIRLPEFGLESQTATNCLVPAAVQEMRAACGGQDNLSPKCDPSSTDFHQFRSFRGED